MIPTVKIKLPHASGDFAIINRSDFDPAIHRLYDESYEVRPKGGGWFNVVGPDGVMNEKSLREADAKALVDRLNAG